jgi:outer membrane protein OmpA-like peptidoglycan-associated protein
VSKLVSTIALAGILAALSPLGARAQNSILSPPDVTIDLSVLNDIGGTRTAPHNRIALHRLRGAPQTLSREQEGADEGAAPPSRAESRKQQARSREEGASEGAAPTSGTESRKPRKMANAKSAPKLRPPSADNTVEKSSLAADKSSTGEASASPSSAAAPAPAQTAGKTPTPLMESKPGQTAPASRSTSAETPQPGTASGSPTSKSAEMTGDNSPGAEQNPAPATQPYAPPAETSSQTKIAAATPPPPPPPPPKAPTKPATLEPGTPPQSGIVAPIRIGFPAGTADLDADAKRELDGVAESLSTDEQRRVQLIAYASGTSEEANQARRLSLSRALNVRAYLIDRGVRNTRMDVRALGNRPEAGQPEDRVDILFVEK